MKEKFITVDMWQIAKEIDKYFKGKGKSKWKK
jgi:hypothetical protein